MKVAVKNEMKVAGNVSTFPGWWDRSERFTTYSEMRYVKGRDLEKKC